MNFENLYKKGFIGNFVLLSNCVSFMNWLILITNVLNLIINSRKMKMEKMELQNSGRI